MKQTAALSLGILGLNESFVQQNELMGKKKNLDTHLIYAFNIKKK